MEYLYDTPALCISYDTEQEWLYVEWKGRHDANTALTGGELILRFLQDRPCRKMLNDNSEVIGDWEKSARWVGTYYYQQMAELGVQYVAWVCPPNWPARKSMEAAMQFISQPMVAVFDELASGYAWLVRQVILPPQV